VRNVEMRNRVTALVILGLDSAPLPTIFSHDTLSAEVEKSFVSERAILYEFQVSSTTALVPHLLTVRVTFNYFAAQSFDDSLPFKVSEHPPVVD
jgi:hypothetical protein